MSWCACSHLLRLTIVVVLSAIYLASALAQAALFLALVPAARILDPLGTKVVSHSSSVENSCLGCGAAVAAVFSLMHGLGWAFHSGPSWAVAPDPASARAAPRSCPGAACSACVLLSGALSLACDLALGAALSLVVSNREDWQWRGGEFSGTREVGTNTKANLGVAAAFLCLLSAVGKVFFLAHPRAMATAAHGGRRSAAGLLLLRSRAGATSYSPWREEAASDRPAGLSGGPRGVGRWRRAEGIQEEFCTEDEQLDSGAPTLLGRRRLIPEGMVSPLRPSAPPSSSLYPPSSPSSPPLAGLRDLGGLSPEQALMEEESTGDFWVGALTQQQQHQDEKRRRSRKDD